MGKQEIVETLRIARKYGQEFYEELLEDYPKQVNFWEELLEVQEKHNEIEACLPNVSDEEFEEFVFLGDLLAVLLK